MRGLADEVPLVYFFVKSLLPLEQSRGGYHERVFGENVGFVDSYGGYIYSLDDGALFSGLTQVRRVGVFALILGILLDFRKSGNRVVLAFVYPSAMRVSHVAPLLLLARLSHGIKVVTIVHDLYKEQWEAFHGRPLLLISPLVRILDLLFLRVINDKILVTSLTVKPYVAELYGLDSSKIVYSPNSSFPSMIKPSGQPRVFTLLYSGSLMKEKGVHELIKIVERLRSEGYLVELVLLGLPQLELSKMEMPWVTSAYVTFPEIQAYYDMTSVCVISFTKNLYFDMVAPVKLFDYMAAGKPVISLRLTEISRIVDEYSCGYVVDDFEEMEELIKELYRNPAALEEAGRNGRSAVEEEFNWGRRVEQLKAVIDDLFSE